MILIALRNIFNHKLKSFLVAVGMIIGICAVTTVFSIGKSGSEQINSTMKALGLDGLIISQAGIALSEGFNDEDISILQNNVSGIASVMPIVYKSVSISNNYTTVAGNVFGLSSNTNNIAGLTLNYGNNFSDFDIKNGNSVCLIDSNTAKYFFGRENVVGKNINVFINGIDYTVKILGVISNKSAIGSIVNAYADNVVFLPYTTICNMVGSNDYNSIAVSLNGSDIDSMKKIIRDNLSEFNPDNQISIQNMSVGQGQMQKITRLITFIITSVAAVSVIVGGVGIMSVMLSNVYERKREIGIKRAVGATKKDIKKEFICEAIVLSVISGILGIFCSFGCIGIIRRIIGINLQIYLNTIIFALLFCIIIGIIFSVYPANKAAGLIPIDCLRNE